MYKVSDECNRVVLEIQQQIDLYNVDVIKGRDGVVDGRGEDQTSGGAAKQVVVQSPGMVPGQSKRRKISEVVSQTEAHPLCVQGAEGKIGRVQVRIDRA